MANESIPIRIRGGGQGIPAMGNIGGRGGRQAPTVAGRGHPIGGSPIATRLSIQQGVPSTDDIVDIFLMVKLNTTSHCITLDLAHVKKFKVALNPRVLAPRPWRSKKSMHHIIHRRRLARASTLTQNTHVSHNKISIIQYYFRYTDIATDDKRQLIHPLANIRNYYK